MADQQPAQIPANLLLSSEEIKTTKPQPAPADGVALCLSGGGYRAMLFHLGCLWRLNQAGLLPKLDRISSVSGGSITAAALGANWASLGFDANPVSPKFEDLAGKAGASACLAHHRRRVGRAGAAHRIGRTTGLPTPTANISSVTRPCKIYRTSRASSSMPPTYSPRRCGAFPNRTCAIIVWAK